MMWDGTRNPEWESLIHDYPFYPFPHHKLSKGGKVKQRDLNKYRQFKPGVSVSQMLSARHSLYLREEIRDSAMAQEPLEKLFAPITSTLFTLRGKSFFNLKKN